MVLLLQPFGATRQFGVSILFVVAVLLDRATLWFVVAAFQGRTTVWSFVASLQLTVAAFTGLRDCFGFVGAAFEAACQFVCHRGLFGPCDAVVFVVTAIWGHATVWFFDLFVVAVLSGRVTLLFVVVASTGPRDHFGFVGGAFEAARRFICRHGPFGPRRCCFVVTAFRGRATV